MPKPRTVNVVLGLVIIALIVTGFWSRYSGNALSDRNARLFITIDDSGFNDTTYYRFLSAVTLRTAEDLGSPNTDVGPVKHFSDSGINILVIDHPEQVAEQLKGKLSENDLALLRAAKRNAVARPPNLLIIDRVFIAELILNTHNDLTGLANLFGSTDSMDLESDRYEQARTLGTIGTYIELANFRQARTSDRSAADSLAPQLLSGWQHEGLGDAFYLAFLPILAHEIAHLRSNMSGQFSPVPAFAKSRLTRRQLQQEERADSLALIVIARAVARLRSESQGHTDVLVAAKAQSLGTLIKYLSDIVAFDAFEGFRGLHAEHTITDINYSNCFDSLASTEYPSLGDFSVERALPRPIPLLLPTEYDSLRARIFTGANQRTHADHLIRAERLASAAWDTLGIDYTGRPKHLAGLLRSFDDRSNWVSESELTQLPITRETALFGLESSLHFQRAIGCVSMECEVAILPNNGGYIEIIRRANQMFSFRAVLRFDSLATEEDLQLRAIFARLLLNLIPFSPTEVGPLAGGILRSLHQCGVVTVTPEFNVHRVAIRTVEPAKSLSITLEPL